MATRPDDTTDVSVSSYETEIRNGAGVKSALGVRSSGGLTKRELFASMAMQGLCADRHRSDTQGNAGNIATFAVEIGDALIAALNK